MKLEMNVYDTANKLAQELKNSEEYVNYNILSLIYQRASKL